MAFWSAIPIIGGIIDKLGKLIPDRSKVADNQARLNELEISGAPASRLRLWRSFLGWCLTLCFVWEVMGRPIVTTYWPNVTLPPPTPIIGDIVRLLFGLLGLGF